MKIQKLILIIFLCLGLIFFIESVLVGLEWIERMSFDYNSEGVYFDANSAVTYDSDALLGYGISTLFFTVLTILFFVKAFLIWKKFIKPTHQQSDLLE